MPKHSILSCTECRDAKLKCIASDDSSICQRCVSRQLACQRPTRKQRARKSDISQPGASTSAVKLEHATPDDASKRRLEHLESVVRDLTRAVKRSRSEARATASDMDEDEEDEDASDQEGDDEAAATPSASGRRPNAAVTTPSSTTETTRAFAIRSRVDDPGLPPLTNPLRLLAEASDDLYAAEPARSHSAAPVTPAPLDASAGPSRSHDGKAIAPHREPVMTSKPSLAPPHRPIPDYRSYFAAGLYSSRPDDSEERSPIACGIVSETRASQLFDHFMGPFNSSTNLLDPKLHTFHFVRSRSNMLLCTLLVLAARVSNAPGAAQETERLERLISDRIIPDILLRDLRSVEIVQGLILFAAFHCPTRLLSEDRAPTFLGHALRMASELDLNSRIVSQELQSDDENVLRHFRNRERAWINLWLYEHSLCTHAGRRPTLSERGIIESCSDWAKSHLAVPGDEALIANVQLRNIISDHRQLYEHLGLGKSLRVNQGEAALTAVRSAALGLKYYLGRIDDDFRRWRARWIRSTVDSKRAAKLQLYDSYGRILSLSLPLQDLDKSVEGIQQTFIMLHESVVLYLDDFLSGRAISSSDLISNQNSTIVTAGYVSVMALKLTSLGGIFHWIDPGALTRRVREVALAFEQAGKVTEHRNATATSYSAYLDTLCSAVEVRNQHRSPSSGARTSRSESRGTSGSGKAGSQKRGRSGKREGGAFPTPCSRENGQNKKQAQHIGQASSVTRSDAIFLPGPSGVQQLQLGGDGDGNGDEARVFDASNGHGGTTTTSSTSEAHDMASALLGFNASNPSTSGIIPTSGANGTSHHALGGGVLSSSSMAHPSSMAGSTPNTLHGLPTSSLGGSSAVGSSSVPTSVPLDIGVGVGVGMSAGINGLLSQSHPSLSPNPHDQSHDSHTLTHPHSQPQPQPQPQPQTQTQTQFLDASMGGAWLSGEFWGDHRAFPSSEELFEWAQGLSGGSGG